ncbi:hypothetical protein GUI12_00795 [Anaplasmataceae bacterium AB001_6]|nr:hypothetical protein GUI12_00795 [Anaplasmataceae bacterium AB001_6]
MRLFSLLFIPILSIGFSCITNEQISEKSQPPNSFNKAWVSNEIVTPTASINLIITKISKDNILEGFIRFQMHDKKDKMLSFDPGSIGSPVIIKDLKGINKLSVCWSESEKYVNNKADYPIYSNGYSDAFVFPIKMQLKSNNKKEERSFTMNYMSCGEACIMIEQKINFKLSDVNNMKYINNIEKKNLVFQTKITESCDIITFSKECVKEINYK